MNYSHIITTVFKLVLVYIIINLDRDYSRLQKTWHITPPSQTDRQTETPNNHIGTVAVELSPKTEYSSFQKIIPTSCPLNLGWLCRFNTVVPLSFTTTTTTSVWRSFFHASTVWTVSQQIISLNFCPMPFPLEGIAPSNLVCHNLLKSSFFYLFS